MLEKRNGMFQHYFKKKHKDYKKTYEKLHNISLSTEHDVVFDNIKILCWKSNHIEPLVKESIAVKR